MDTRQDDEASKDLVMEKSNDSDEPHDVFAGDHVSSPKKSLHRRRSRHSILGLPTSEDEGPPTPPSERVRLILGEDVSDEKHQSHPLFSELEELVRTPEGQEWREVARWVKFEEDVEEGGNRWSKPHVASLFLQHLFELRSLVSKGTVLLDLQGSSLEQIVDLVADGLIGNGSMGHDKRRRVKSALLKRHVHQHQRESDNSFSTTRTCMTLSCITPKPTSKRKKSTDSLNEKEVKRNGSYVSLPGTDKPQAMPKSASKASMPRNFSNADLEPTGDSPFKPNLDFMRKVPSGAEASNILVGEVDFLDKPVCVFVRLSSAIGLGNFTEVPVPTRFIFVHLGPPNSIGYRQVGRSVGALMSDEIFREVAYRARSTAHLLAGIDEFLDAVTVLPPGEWDPSIRIEPPPSVPSQDPRKNPPEGLPEEADEEGEAHRLRQETGLVRSGVPFGGLVNDVKRKAPFYWSDFKDALASQTIASWFFLYFACLSPIITFGGLLSQATGNNMAAMESLVSGFVCGMGYGLFSGQPLTILGSTGPVLVFETIVYNFSLSIGWDYMSFRFWIGTWVAVILFILVAIDASSWVCYITRFTEENFAILIAIIFIYEAIGNVLLIGKNFPMNTSGYKNLDYNCSCVVDDTVQALNPEVQDWTALNKSACLSMNGTLFGSGCDTPTYVPDVFLMSVILCVGTFLMSVELKDFKNALFFPSKVRQVISDFAVFIAIVSMTLLDYESGVPTPKLEVPHEFKPTLPTRGWLIPPFNSNPWYSVIFAIPPALLGTILIFMDQQITAVIVNRKEYKLKKKCGYHLDLFVLAILIQICTVMGLPWFVAATVLSINHVNSLKLESECSAPGEKPQFLGVREQRVTHIMIFLTIGMSVFLTPVLGHIPMPVLYGVFLYMGISSLGGLHFFNRILIIFMPNKYQPDYIYLRQVPLLRVHLFTLIQLTCLGCLWTIKSFSTTSILFPLMLVVMVAIRKFLDYVFTRRELKILDDLMPEMTKKRQKIKDAEMGCGSRIVQCILGPKLDIKNVTNCDVLLDPKYDSQIRQLPLVQ